jgi:type I restriction enzyme S subunit
MKIIPELRFSEFEDDGEWVEKKLKSLAVKIGDGIHSTPKYDLSGEYHFINGNNLIGGQIVVDDKTKRVSFSEFQIHKKDLTEKTVLLSINGTIGNIAFYSNEKVVLGKSACYITPRHELNNIFLYYSLQTPKIGSYFLSELTGSTIKNLSLKTIRETAFNLPPDKKGLEQQKIASCLSSLDELIAAHSQKLDLLKDHKKGLMQNLFPQEGEKVPKYRFAEFEKDGEWVEKKLGEVAELTSSKRVHLADYVSSGVPFFRGKEISQLKNNQFPDDILYISNEQYKEIKDKYGVPKRGDILITAVGTLGNVYCIKNDDKFYFKDGNLIWMKNIAIYSHFLEVLLDVEKGKVLASAIGSSQKALTMAALNKLAFQIPENPREQQKIASCLSAVDELITAQAERIAQLQQHKKGLMQGLFPKMEG